MDLTVTLSPLRKMSSMAISWFVRSNIVLLGKPVDSWHCEAGKPVFSSTSWRNSRTGTVLSTVTTCFVSPWLNRKRYCIFILSLNSTKKRQMTYVDNKYSLSSPSPVSCFCTLSPAPDQRFAVEWTYSILLAALLGFEFRKLSQLELPNKKFTNHLMDRSWSMDKFSGPWPPGPWPLGLALSIVRLAIFAGIKNYVPAGYRGTQGTVYQVNLFYPQLHAQTPESPDPVWSF